MEFAIFTPDKGPKHVMRTVYEACVFQALRDRLRCKEIWVVGADKWRNPTTTTLDVGPAAHGWIEDRRCILARVARPSVALLSHWPGRRPWRETVVRCR
ncbi:MULTISPECIES: hypothetical protein [unclassified Streptomyces]|uniref:hypothetical protein n=1 Tax=unclassified Streptomyces TaxID=2593676 RepID=UPI0035DE9E7D